MQVCDARGVETLVRATDDHFGDEAIVATACGLLRHLAKSDTVKKLFVEIDGLKHASKVLEAHKQSVRVCTQVRSAAPLPLPSLMSPPRGVHVHMRHMRCLFFGFPAVTRGCPGCAQATDAAMTPVREHPSGGGRPFVSLLS